MTDDQVFTIQLNDEIPKFRSGWRRITVTHNGREWVKLQCGRKKVTMRKSEWAELVARQAERNLKR